MLSIQNNQFWLGLSLCEFQKKAPNQNPDWGLFKIKG